MQVHVDRHVVQVSDVIHSVNRMQVHVESLVGTDCVSGSRVLLSQQKSLCGTCTISMLCRVHTAKSSLLACV